MTTNNEEKLQILSLFIHKMDIFYILKWLTTATTIKMLQLTRKMLKILKSLNIEFYTQISFLYISSIYLFI